MKICVLLSSYDGSRSPLEAYDFSQNPGLYAKSHDFVQQFVTKRNAKETIDRIIQEDFDYIWHFMCGPVDGNIAGVDEIKYLESKNVPMIGSSSKFVSLTKLDCKDAMVSANINTPKGMAIIGDEESIANLNIGDLQFPLIVKPSVGSGSEYMTPESVCNSASELVNQIRLLKSKIHVNHEILLEEFVEGEDVQCIIIETMNGVVALEPILNVFPNNWPATRKFLDFDLRLAGVRRGLLTYELFEKNPVIKERIKETAIKAYEALGVLGSGYARVNFRICGLELFVVGINPCPAFFIETGNLFGENFIIESTFPGCQENLVDTIISSKRRLDTILQGYNSNASIYDSQDKNREGCGCVIDAWNYLIDTFDYSESVLDLGSGTGMLGKMIKRKFNAKITGIDISPEMVKLSKDYEQVYIGLLENVVFELKSSFKHIVTNGAFEFVDHRYFTKIFSRMFQLATNSISLAVEDFPEEVISHAAMNHAALFNHVETIETFQIPPGWSLVHKKRQFLWESPRMGTKIYGLVLRYENNREAGIGKFE